MSPIKSWRNSKNQHKYLGKKGKIVSFTQINAGPAGFENQTPYWAGIIKLESGERVAGQIKVLSFGSSNSRSAKKEREINFATTLAGARVIGILRKMRDVGEEDVVEYGIKWRIL